MSRQKGAAMVKIIAEKVKAWRLMVVVEADSSESNKTFALLILGVKVGADGADKSIQDRLGGH